MKEKTRTVVVIESQETIVRRSRRTTSAQVVTLPSERPATKYHLRLGAWWKTVSLKGATVFAPWSRRLQLGQDDRKNKKP